MGSLHAPDPLLVSEVDRIRAGGYQAGYAAGARDRAKLRRELAKLHAALVPDHRPAVQPGGSFTMGQAAQLIEQPPANFPEVALRALRVLYYLADKGWRRYEDALLHIRNDLGDVGWMPYDIRPDHQLELFE